MKRHSLSLTLTSAVSSYTPTKNPGDLLRVKVDYDPSVNRLRGATPAQSCGEF